jgi:hypothetical protein
MGKSYSDKDIEATAHDPTDHGIGEIKDLKIDKNQDAALEFLRGGGDVRPMSAADEKTLLRKIDWRIMVSCLSVGRPFVSEDDDTDRSCSAIDVRLLYSA